MGKEGVGGERRKQEEGQKASEEREKEEVSRVGTWGRQRWRGVGVGRDDHKGRASSEASVSQNADTVALFFSFFKF